MKTLKHELNRKIVEFCSRTTSHGIPNIVNTNKNYLSRLMWLFFFLASLSYCVYIIVNSLVDYFKYRTNIAIELDYESPAVFPAVTICNINPFNEFFAKDYIRKISENYEEFECFKNTQDDEKLIECFRSRDILDVFIDRLKRVVANDRSIDAVKRDFLGYYLDNDMLLSCTFNDIECYEENFTLSWSHQFGSCYTFNNGKTGPLLLTSGRGSSYGLKMELSVRPPYNDTMFGFKKGLFVMVHNQSSQPFTLIPNTDDGISLIPTGFETYISVDRTFINKLPSPYSNCLQGLKRHNNYSNVLFKYFDELKVSEYSQDFCFSLCYQDKLINECGCCDLITPSLRNSSFCISDTELRCMKSFISKFSTSDLNVFCEHTCLEQCSKREYQLTNTMASYPTSTYLKYLASDFRYYRFFPHNDESALKEFGREGLLRLVVNYGNLYYTSINENAAMTFEQLLGNIGGQLGLFIGISFLSFVEIIELLYELLIIFMTHFRASTTVPSSTNAMQPQPPHRTYYHISFVS